MEIVNEPQPPERNLTAILFPGVVKNEGKAIQCLGGIRNISHVYSGASQKKRLGLSFQPENPFIKKVYGDSRKGAGVLLKVKIKKTKIGDEVKKEVISTSIVGRVNNIYKFESLCDFQYMPVHKEDSEPVKCCLEEILPSGTDPFSFLNEPCPLYVVPSSFTRTEKPINYSYTDKRYGGQVDTDDVNDNVHNKRRSARTSVYNKYEFSLTNELPLEPHDNNMKHFQAKVIVQPSLQEEYETVKKLFDQRPIWSLNLIKYETKISGSSLKLLLPCVGIYMRKGPWKMVWTRFGYDPRKDPKARIYQTLDFRVRNQAGVNSMVTTRLAHYHKKLDEIPSNSKKSLNESSSEIVSEGTVYFRPGVVPTQRQVYYQFCDIQIPEVQELLALEPAPGYLCHHIRGWLPPNMEQVCRDHIFRYVKETVLATYNADLKLEQESGEEDNSDDSTNDTNEAEGDEISQ